MSANNNLGRDIGSMYLLVVPHEDKRHQHIFLQTPSIYIFAVGKRWLPQIVTFEWADSRISAQYTELKVDFPNAVKIKADASVVVTWFLTFLVNWQDMGNNRLKNQLATPSPVHISTSAPASAHCKIFNSFSKTSPVKNGTQRHNLLSRYWMETMFLCRHPHIITQLCLPSCPSLQMSPHSLGCLAAAMPFR